MHPPIVSWHSWHSAMVPTPNTVFYADSRSLAPVPLGRLDRGQGCVGDRCHAASAGAGLVQQPPARSCDDPRPSGTSDPAVAEALADAELVLGDQVPNPDRQFVVLPGAAHALVLATTGTSFGTVNAFLTMPARRDRQ